MKNRLLSAVVFVLLFSLGLEGQSFVFGPKLGPSIGFQRWNNFDQDALLAYHAALFIESYSEEGNGTLYAQLGYYTRGSAIRVTDILQGRNFSSSFKFNNLGLTLGAKQMIQSSSSFKPYYHFGLRLEYTLSTNLDQYENFNSVFYPTNEFVRKLNYGVSLGGGFQKNLSEFIGAALEVTVSPDLSKQYEQPALSNVIIPGQGTQTRNIQARDIRNLSFEISLVLRLLRKVEYY